MTTVLIIFINFNKFDNMMLAYSENVTKKNIQLDKQKQPCGQERKHVCFYSAPVYSRIYLLTEYFCSKYIISFSNALWSTLLSSSLTLSKINAIIS